MRTVGIQIYKGHSAVGTRVRTCVVRSSVLSLVWRDASVERDTTSSEFRSSGLHVEKSPQRARPPARTGGLRVLSIVTIRETKKSGCFFFNHNCLFCLFSVFCVSRFPCIIADHPDESLELMPRRTLQWMALTDATQRALTLLLI